MKQNTFEPCKDHENGHFGWCLLCEIEQLRVEVNMLRREKEERDPASWYSRKSESYYDPVSGDTVYPGIKQHTLSPIRGAYMYSVLLLTQQIGGRMKKMDSSELVEALLSGAICGIVCYFFLLLFLSIGE